MIRIDNIINFILNMYYYLIHKLLILLFSPITLICLRFVWPKQFWRSFGQITKLNSDVCLLLHLIFWFVFISTPFTSSLMNFDLFISFEWESFMNQAIKIYELNVIFLSVWQFGIIFIKCVYEESCE